MNTHVTVYICELERGGSLSQGAVWMEGFVIRTLKHIVRWKTGSQKRQTAQFTESVLVSVRSYIHACLHISIHQVVGLSSSNDKVMDVIFRNYINCKIKYLLHK